uniref:HTH psq-type domain-containing protein n=1 Tax=Romanomermis culicivorax TaxID=13658 RepID=A0A915IDY8_ROMCU
MLKAAPGLEDLEKAIEAIRNGSKIRAASRVYNIPYGTLQNKVNARHLGTIGRKAYLTTAEELLLVKLVNLVTVVGVPFTKDCLITIIDSYLHGNKPELFKVKKSLGREWFRSFFKRHGNELSSERIPQNLSAVRTKALTQFVASKWFNLFKPIIQKLALDLKLECIWNVDKTGLSTDVGCSKVLCAKDMQNAHRIVADEGKFVLTIVSCSNATNCCLGGLNSFRYSVTENGWIDR